ncbi:sporulation initiation phosphotransferase B [Salipaludibacillus sp. LMS25]|jgi:stage 0 sporulation protein B (sporulation initiation phosphotransferase)|uniref:Spo0B C-terminal domain-containing protein n=1 Tax=Salipaludibacillus sp. LMS25 TaxID=2924031 RepID=UPI0020CFFD7B|nr:Spo0B C-terminal domain-containing protein [Salipaludibacillus sp. LMS25]UTR14236.1 sporulation initiation phosphotransferase B [Salipaludibacillus sp. LMS25]
MEQKGVVNVLRHYRHDVLNHIQLINGYLEMEKIEKVHSLIDDLVRQAKNESHLSNLNMDQFAEDILTFNWTPHAVCLSFEVVSSSNDWSEWEEVIVSFFRAMMALFDTYVISGEDQQVFIMISDIDGKGLEIDFHGTLSTDGRWQEDIMDLKKTYKPYLTQFEWNESECYVKFNVE